MNKLAVLIIAACIPSVAYADDTWSPESRSELWEQVLDPEASLYVIDLREIQRLLRQSKTRKAAREQLQNLRKKYPSRSEIIVVQAEQFARDHEWKDCSKYYAQAHKVALRDSRQIELFPFQSWSRCLANAGELDKATETLRLAVDYSRGSRLADVQEKLGELLAAQGKLHEALQMLRAARKPTGRNPELDLTIAAIYVRLGSDHLARRYLDRVRTSSAARLATNEWTIPKHDSFFRGALAQLHHSQFIIAADNLAYYASKESKEEYKKLARGLYKRALAQLGNRPQVTSYSSSFPEVLQKVKDAYPTLQACAGKHGDGKIWKFYVRFRSARRPPDIQRNLPDELKKCVRDELKKIRAGRWYRVDITIGHPRAFPSD